MFKPMKAPQELAGVDIPFSELKFPLLVSPKLDGYRCIIKDGGIYSSAMKDFPNVFIYLRFKLLAEWAEAAGIILDGELLAKSVTFNELGGIIRSDGAGLPEDLSFYGFDSIYRENYAEAFEKRINSLDKLPWQDRFYQIVPQILVNNAQEIGEEYRKALAQGCDGLMLRDPQGRYKFGHTTVREGLIYKMKPYKTFDAQIVGVVQATKVDPNAEKKVNGLGYSVTSKKKGDRVLVEKASAFWVLHNGVDRLKVVIADKDYKKEEIWQNRHWYVGKWVEYKGLEVGAKNLPRHPTSLRMRLDKI